HATVADCAPTPAGLRRSAPCGVRAVALRPMHFRGGDRPGIRGPGDASAETRAGSARGVTVPGLGLGAKLPEAAARHAPKRPQACRAGRRAVAHGAPRAWNVMLAPGPSCGTPDAIQTVWPHR